MDSMSVHSPVEIVGIVKAQSTERVREALNAGLKILGINYVQEGKSLRTNLGNPTIQWHFAGHIQSRKVKQLTNFDCVQSLDRKAIAMALSNEMLALGKKMPVLLEINVGEEKQKSGILVGEVRNFLSALIELKGLMPLGFMCMPPPLEPVEARRSFFRMTKKLFEEFRNDFKLTTLSMGTSRDYRIAIEEGATQVRLGACLFGERPARKAL